MASPEQGTVRLRVLYTIIYTTVFILAAPYWLTRGLFNRAYLKNLKARFIGPGRVLPKLDNRPRVWVWALSLGEVLSARELVKNLEAAGAEVVVTATTLSGLAMARSTWPQLAVLPSPLDFRMSTRRFLDLVDPDMLILVETDIWPGILLQMSRRALPRYLVSARVSERSFRGYKRIRFFWSKVLRLFDAIAAQTAEDREKLVALGADPAKVGVAGNLKFDQPEAPMGPEEKRRLLDETGWPDGRWLVAGSVHMGEETLVMRAFLELWPRHRDLRLLIAPRDRHKFSLNWRVIREMFPNDSARRSRPSPSDSGARVFLLDSLGELERFYSLAEVALIGKSWPGAHEGGGHNPLEAAARGKPVLAGPKVNNFKWMYHALVAAGGALLVERSELAGKLDEFLSRPGTLEEMGRRGHDFVFSHRGAVKDTLALIKPPLPALEK
jgi:3-deoxy-D-manno-octulosonic-acid transferase